MNISYLFLIIILGFLVFQSISTNNFVSTNAQENDESIEELGKKIIESMKSIESLIYQTTNETSYNINWSSYTSNRLGFSINYVNDSEVKEKESRFDQGPDLLISSYPKSFIDFQIQVFVDQNNNNLDLDDYSKQYQQNILSGYNRPAIKNDLVSNIDYRLIEGVDKWRYMIDGNLAHSLVLELIFFDSKGEILDERGTEVTIVRHNNQHYIFSIISPAHLFDNQLSKSLREHIMNSIKWID